MSDQPTEAELRKADIERQRAEAMAARGNAPAAAPAMPNQSRLTLARAGIRPAMKGRVMLSGPAGAGKTYTALVIATALVGPTGRILVIDSEKESSLTYADVFSFHHLRWNPPFDPTALSLTLKEAQVEFDACVVDSFSHWWRKKGGVLDIAGDNVRGWKAARPIQEDLIETILDVDMHMIVCCRSKMEHLIQDNGRGGMTVTKAGIKAQQDDDLEYEVNVALEIDMPHVLHVVKSRTNAVPVGSQYLAGLAGDFAQQYRDWLRSGEEVASKEATDLLSAGLDQIEDKADRQRLKYAFLDQFGRPEFLLESRLAEAQQWVVDAVTGNLPVDRGPDETPPEGGAADEAAPASEAPAAAPPASAEAPHPDSVQAGSAEPPEVMNGDAGHCDLCGQPTWFSIAQDAQGAPGWRHADPEHDQPPHPVGAAGPEVDVDALLEAWPAQVAKIARVTIEAQVGALTPTKVNEALAEAGLQATGTPKQCRERLVNYRLGLTAGQAAQPAPAQ